MSVPLLSAAAAMDHPYAFHEEEALRAFRSRHVDLSDRDMQLGRALADLVVRQCEKLSGQVGCPAVLASRSFVAGSFGRRTLCQPLDDIDVYLVLNACAMVMLDGGAVYRLEGGGVGPLTSDYSLRILGWISSGLVLGRVASGLWRLPVMGAEGVTVGVGAKGKSAFIAFPRWGLKVDVTPVVWATNFINSVDRYYMPQGRGSIWWKATNPKADQRRLSAQNQMQGGLLLPAIRMLKWWNEKCNAGRMKGILLEVMAERALSDYYLDGVAQALHLVFASLPSQLAGSCPDPTGLGPALDANLEPADRSESIRAATDAHLCAVRAANRVSTGDVPGALAEWHRMFVAL